MTFKKRYLALVVLLALIGWTYSWTFTSHGRLDYAAAFSLKALSFEREVKPHPGSDYEIKLPINLIYALSGLMPKEDVARTEDIVIPSPDFDVPARIYWPEGYDEAGEKPPVIVYMHGGGFVVGSVDIFDPLTRSLANAANAIVVSVDYRLAPEHPFPAAVNDSYAALLWAAENMDRLGGDPDKLVVGGDSAGGNLAAVTSLKSTMENGPRIAAQLLYYPATDLTEKSYPSKENFADGYGLSSAAAEAFHEAYFIGQAEADNPYLSPLYADSLEGLPAALVLTAGFDPLTDSAKAYADRMMESGVDVTYQLFPTTVHGFMSVQLFKQRREGLDATAVFLDETL